MDFSLVDLWRLGPLIAFLPLPVWILHRRGREARAEFQRRQDHPQRGDPLPVWFSYWRFQNYLLLAFWMVWFVLLAVFDAIRTVWVLFGEGIGHPLVITGLWCAGPPLVVVSILSLQSSRVLSLIPGIGWERERALQWSVGSAIALLGPLIALGWFVDASLARGHPPLSFCLGFGVLTGLLGLTITGASSVRLSLPLPDGPIKDRLREMEEDFGISRRSSLVVPTISWRLAPVLHSGPRGILLTPGILPHLSIREVDAVLAHQLAESGRAAIRNWWLAPLLTVLTIGILAGLAYLQEEGLADFMRWWPLLLSLVCFHFSQTGHRVGLLAGTGDVAGVGLTGDPEALLTALNKLRQRRLLPLNQEEPEPPPPGEPWPRLEDLAARARIPPDRLEEILAGPGCGSDSYPPLSDLPGLTAWGERIPDTRVFSTTFRGRLAHGLGWLMFGGEILLLALAAWIAHVFRMQGWVLALFYLAGVLVAFFYVRTLLRSAGAWTSRHIRTRLRQRLEQQQISFADDQSVFIGLAPGREFRTHEGFHDWDLGFLIDTPTKLVYLGDRTRFALAWQDIVSLEVGPGPPGWKPSRRVYLTWTDSKCLQTWVLQLSTCDPWLDPAGLHPEELHQRLTRWQERAQGPEGLSEGGEAGVFEPPWLPALLPPDIPSTTGDALRLVLDLVLFPLQVLGVGIPALCLGAILGLPFALEAPGSAWHLLAGLVLVEFLHRVPQLLSWSFRRGGDAPEEPGKAP
jgi:hypothetical protein